MPVFLKLLNETRKKLSWRNLFWPTLYIVLKGVAVLQTWGCHCDGPAGSH